MADDLEQLFAPPLASPSQDMRYRQGVIQTFNQITLQNTVLVGGTTFTDLPILGVGESTLLAPGAVVGVISVLSERGVATWAIVGRMVIPNTADAFSAISLLSAWVATSSITTQETTNSATYVDLTTPGPSVTVNVRQTGRVLLLFSSQIQFIDTDPLDNGGGAVTVALTGANTLTAAAAETTIRATMTFGANTITSDTLQGTYTQSVVLEGLNSGLTTFTMKYKANSSENTDFGRRTLTVITL